MQLHLVLVRYTFWCSCFTKLFQCPLPLVTMVLRFNLLLVPLCVGHSVSMILRVFPPKVMDNGKSKYLGESRSVFTTCMFQVRQEYGSFAHSCEMRCIIIFLGPLLHFVLEFLPALVQCPLNFKVTI